MHSLFLLLLLLLVVVFHITTAAVAIPKKDDISFSNVGPISLFPSKGLQFKWRASVENTFGKATSKETSVLTWKRNYSTSKESIQSLKRVSKKWVEGYPQWLPKVAWGLLRATTTTTTRSKQSTTTTTTIQPRFWDCNLLSFGNLQVRKMNRRGCELELPIVSGLLALGNKNQGCLKFYAVVEPNNKGSDNDRITCRFQSKIGGNYCPWIAGGEGSPMAQKWMYLSTQSIVHAYIMWRFHKRWADRVRKIC